MLPLALPATPQHLWVSKPVKGALQPLTWFDQGGVARPGFRLPLLVGEPACLDPHSPHAIPSPLPSDLQAPHVLLVGYSVPWLERATPAQQHDLQSRLEASRGGVQPGVDYDISKQACTASPGRAGSQQGGEVASSGGVQFQKNQAGQTPPGRVFSLLPETQEGDFVGLLDACMMAEGTEGRMDSASTEARPEQDPGEVVGGLEEDVQPDTFAEGSATFRGAYARRLEARVFEPAHWTQVKQYLEGLDMEHLIPAIDDLGVDSLEDFGFLYREDLMEAGASKEEAEAILGCTRAELDGRPDGPAQARAGYHRPSRPIAPARPATAARLVRAPDRANSGRFARL